MLSKIGSFILQRFSSVPYVIGYIGKVFSSSLFFMKRERAATRILIMQLLFTFIEALSIVSILAAGLGSALYVVGHNFLLSFGQGSLIYDLPVVVVSRELGPLLVAFVVTARSATAIATELGSMVTSHQIESYISVGVDPIDYLVSPRFLGVTLSVFLLSIYFSLFGLLFPAIMAKIVNNVPPSIYFRDLFQKVSVMTVVTVTIKSIVFGMVIAVTSTYYGFNVERASTEIPVAGIQAVSKSFFGIIIADVCIMVCSFLL